MQSMPLLLRHSLRSSLALTRTSRPLRGTPLATAAAGPSPFLSRKDSRRDFSVCLRCQFRARPSFYYSSHETDKPKDENNPTERKQEEKKEEEEVNPPATTTSTTTTTTSTTAANEPAKQPEVQAEGEQRTQSAAPPENHENSHQRYEPEHEDVRRPEAPEDQGLPSTMERRRSQWSKQFSEMMDNVQSNIFVAGQRLNDLTGYSAIETLKKEIHEQEAQLRAARAHVRQTKDNYTAAINRRSTSQREVNELLQRKHAWSAADLERFTHLYRNDHANEVGENEAQEAFSVAEREAEEAAAILSKSILSRYHEEQVWSDKIRRMSTWGTWGLMGVNVLLFLVFQIAVEPWRRSRLVRGFEEKVLEALQKNNAEVADIHNHFYTTAREEVLDSSDSESIPIADASEPIKPTTEAIPPANETPTTDTPALKPSSSTGETTPTAAAAAPTTPTSILETGKFHLSRFVSRFVSLLPSASTESWRNTLHDLFSDRSITITQCDLTTIALQSAAAGAAAMGLVIALIRPR